MLSDHIGDSIIGHFSFFNYLGRISFPLFAFQITQGYQYTKNLKKYILKLLIWGCISQIPFMLFLSTFQTGNDIYVLNIFFTFILGIFAILCYDKLNNKVLAILLVIFISFIGHILQVDYGAFGILLIFCFYLFQNKKAYLCLSTIILSIMQYIPKIIDTPQFISHYALCAFFTCLSLIFICTYKNEEGPKVKYLFYLFYPLHMFVLYLLHLAL